MLREYKKVLDVLHLVVTGALIVAAYAVLHWFMQGRAEPLRALRDYMPTIGLLTCSVLLTLSHRGFSAFGAFATPASVLGELAMGYALGLMIYVFAAYALKLPHLSRAFIFGGIAWSYAGVAAWHLGTYAFYRRLMALGWNARRVLLVGSDTNLPRITETLQGHKSLGLAIAGVINMDRLQEGILLEDGRREGLSASDGKGLSDIGAALDSMVVDYAFFGAYKQNPDWIEAAMSACQERGIEIWLKPDFLQEDVLFSRFDHLQDIPMLIFSLSPRQGLGILVKQAIDLALSLLLLVLLALPMLAVALLIRLESRGPSLFKQTRVGLNGRRFSMLKFRTMVERDQVSATNAAPALHNELSGPIFKMTGDPRITRLGRILRRYSIDELPQLWNVLTGDMSLVGPRPPLPSEVRHYEAWQRRRLSMRPGMTGLWQVSGRNAIKDFNEWVNLDLKYIDSWSLWQDAKILARTVRAVVMGTGV
ncbi:MAG: sugar transferase [Elusimicrobia bacterium]|nr:sugar transferase [Elusimicrobiota bacterium]